MYFFVLGTRPDQGTNDLRDSDAIVGFTSTGEAIQVSFLSDEYTC
jgi:hypothetical protein